MIDERYAAGFFDGEGCIHIARNVRVIISGCFHPGLLDLFSERWGGRVTAQRNAKKNQRSGVRWEITGKRTETFLSDLLPYLIEKKEQAELALHYQRKKIALNVRGGKGYSDSQRAYFKEVEVKLRSMKQTEYTYF